MRIAIPVLAIGLGLLLALAAYRNVSTSREDTAPPPTTTPSAAAPSDQVDTSSTTDAVERATIRGPDGADAADWQVDPPAATAAVEPVRGLKVRPAAHPGPASIGSRDTESGYKMEVQLSAWSAAVKRIILTDFSKHANDDEPYVVHDTLRAKGHELIDGAWRMVEYLVRPYAARAITVNGQTIDLQGHEQETQQQIWDLVEASPDHVTYRLTLETEKGEPVIEVLRTYRIEPGSYDLWIEQRFTNLGSRPLHIGWAQFAQGDTVDDPGAYLGDRRMFLSGYFDPQYDPNRLDIYTDHTLVSRLDLIQKKGRSLWPNRKLGTDMRLAWLGSENRYFAVATHALITGDMTATEDVPDLETLFPKIGTWVFPQGEGLKPEDQAMVITLESDDRALPVGQSIDLSLAVYAGPRDPEVLALQPYSILRLDRLVRYSLGGPCAFCTFQWLAKGLLGFLKIIHAGLRDWGVAIIILVIVVRLILHPITKKAQVNMMKMGKQMQALQPEVEKLKNKYKDDQKKLNQEMMKIYRDKGINPANMLGCLPMFLQMPIWIALYAMLYFAIELRHQPAFYGIFQAVSGQHWPFLGDLSTSDRFIPILDEARYFSMIFIKFDYSSINILPLLMTVVFYFQQKLTTPPAANEQQAQQQKIMKFMMLLFPIFLYSAPSGLTLYILASTSAGIVDSYFVRKHVREQEESGELFKPAAKPKTGGIMDRLGKAVAQRQKQLAQPKRGGRDKPARKKRRKS